IAAIRGTERYGVWAEGRHYSALMLAARITLPHFSVSSAMSFSNSAGDIGIGTLPSSARRALIFSAARAALISLVSVTPISSDVPFVAPMPCHVLASQPELV